MIEAIGFALIIIAFGSLAYGWRKWFVMIRSSNLPPWRRIAATVGCVSVTAQAVRFVASFIHTGPEATLLGGWLTQALALFIVASSSLLIGASPSRWPLLLSSVLLFVLSFFVVISE